MTHPESSFDIVDATLLPISEECFKIVQNDHIIANGNCSPFSFIFEKNFSKKDNLEKYEELYLYLPEGSSKKGVILTGGLQVYDKGGNEVQYKEYSELKLKKKKRFKKKLGAKKDVQKNKLNE